MWFFAKRLILTEPDGGRMIIRYPRHWERQHPHGTQYAFCDKRTDTVLQLIILRSDIPLSFDDLAKGTAERMRLAEATAVEGSFQFMNMVSKDAVGFYCWSQDRELKPGDHAWMMQGYFIPRGRIFDFRILSHRPPPKATKEAFQILEYLCVIPAPAGT